MYYRLYIQNDAAAEVKIRNRISVE